MGRVNVTLGQWCQFAKWCQCEPVMRIYNRIANLVPTRTGMEIAYSKTGGGGVGGVLLIENGILSVHQNVSVYIYAPGQNKLS